MRWLPFAHADPRRTPPWLTARPYAHRGLHGGDRVENSRAAFTAAIEAGFGIELDVQAAACGTAFVFHDDTLDRLSLSKGPVSDLRADALNQVVLRGTGEHVPQLEEVLALIAGRTPILIEIKRSRQSALLCRSIGRALAFYQGEAAIMSFDPAIVRWFARHVPQRTRGLVVSEHGKASFRHRLARHLALSFSHPDFLAYDIRSLPSPFAARARRRGLALLSWTVRTMEEARRAASYADQVIHELPDAP